MFDDAELEKLTVSELQDLLILYPIRQIVVHLNRRSMKNDIQHNKLRVSDMSEYKTRLEAARNLSTEFQATERAVGPRSWFYHFLSPKPWFKYLSEFEESLKGDY